MKKKLAPLMSDSYVSSIVKEILKMTTKKKLGYISIALATAVSGITIGTFTIGVPFKAGGFAKRVEVVEASLAEVKDDLKDLSKVKEDTAYIRGWIDNQKEKYDEMVVRNASSSDDYDNRRVRNSR